LPNIYKLKVLSVVDAYFDNGFAAYDAFSASRVIATDIVMALTPAFIHETAELGNEFVPEVFVTMSPIVVPLV
jgi:hypothetical protein